MFDIMSVHYNNIKDQVGLKEVFDTTESDDETDKIFQKLRPQSPYKFKELIKTNLTPKRSPNKQESLIRIWIMRG